MDPRVILSEDSLIRLKCSWCKGVLSVPPICLSKGKFTCGRCNSNGIRIPVYEELAKLIIFPCVYDTCKEKLPWDKVKIHEKQCLHKTTLCPFYTCQKTYELRRILAHFEKCHKEFILPNPVKTTRNLRDHLVKRFRSDAQVFMTIYEKTEFLIFVDSICVFDDEKMNIISAYDYSFGVFSTDEKTTANFKYEVTLDQISDKGIVTHVKKDQKVEAYDDKIHCHECLFGHCHLKYHKKSTDFLTTKFLTLNKHNNMRLTYTVHIYSDNEEQSRDVPKNDEIAMKLECPICKEYMCAPIYNCAMGHTICGDCNGQIKECPFCKAEIGKSRNYILEEIAEALKIPCENTSKGCKFVGCTRSTKDHEKSCNFN